MHFAKGAALALAMTILALLPTTPTLAAEVNLYTTREPALIKPLLEAFTKKTGIAVNTVFVSTGLPERVEAEGANSPADVLMTVDIGNLADLVDAGVTQPIEAGALEAVVPANLRDPGKHWFALSARARVLYVAKDLDLTSFTYEELADPKWKGKICIRSGQHPYNIALIAAYIAKHGLADAETWLTGLKANLAHRPAGGDREVARDILGGLCQIGVGNSYYVGLMRSGAGGPEQKAWGDGIKVILPTFAGGATHVNISGIAIAKNAPNKANAYALLDYLASDEGQQLFAHANFEYPIKADVAPDPIIAALGTLHPDPSSLVDIESHRKEASELVDKVGFDN